MKKIIFLSGFWAFISNVYAQTYDITTYKIGKDWKEDNSNPTALQLMKTSEADTSFCIISVSKALAVTGNAMADFKADWQKYATNTVGVKIPDDAKIYTEKRTDSRTLNSGVGAFKHENATNYFLLYTFSNANNKVVVTIITNNSNYVSTIEKFTKELAFAKGKTVTNSAPNPIALTKPVLENTKPTTVAKPAATKGLAYDLIGEWFLSDGSVNISLLFAGNGQYKRIYSSTYTRPIALNLYTTTSFEGNGTYTLSGTTLTINPKNSAKETHQVRITFEKNSSGVDEKKLYLTRPVASGGTYESEYWWVK